MLIDSHCHLNDPSFSLRVDEVIERAKRAGVGAFLVPAYDRGSLERTRELGSNYSGVILPAYGIHPWYLEEGYDCGEIDTFLDHEYCIAVGEIGLDFSPGLPTVELQEEALRIQLDLAVKHSFPVMIHCRKAYERLYEIIKSYNGMLTGVLHSFSGSREMMEKFLEEGFYISFSGAVTRKTAKKYHKNARKVPLERILVETDAPSIATESTVASAVEPMHTVEVAKKIAELRGISYRELCDATTKNTMRLFQLQGIEGIG